MPHGQHIVHIGERQVDILGSDVLAAIEKVLDDAQIRVFEKRLRLNNNALGISQDATLKVVHEMLVGKIEELESTLPR